MLERHHAEFSLKQQRDRKTDRIIEPLLKDWSSVKIIFNRSLYLLFGEHLPSDIGAVVRQNFYKKLQSRVHKDTATEVPRTTPSPNNTLNREKIRNASYSLYCGY